MGELTSAIAFSSKSTPLFPLALMLLLLEDDDDMIREDIIEYSYFEEFGFDNSKDFNIFDEILDEEDEWGSDDYDYIENEDSIITFLNEYYVVYPKKLPKPEYK
jgi:hypothetical protein